MKKLIKDSSNNFEIIPAIDIIDGKCVRLRMGNYQKQINYDLNPLDIARKVEDIGFERIHIIDLDRARDDLDNNSTIVNRVISTTNLKVQIGGGIRSRELIGRIANLGVNRIIVSSILFDANFESIVAGYESVIVPSLDFAGENLAISGWQSFGGLDFDSIALKIRRTQIQTVIVTDTQRDGTMEGPNIDLALDIKKKLGASVILAGGVSSEDDILKVKDAGLDGVIVGRFFYEEILKSF